MNQRLFWNTPVEIKYITCKDLTRILQKMRSLQESCKARHSWQDSCKAMHSLKESCQNRTTNSFLILALDVEGKNRKAKLTKIDFNDRLFIISLELLFFAAYVICKKNYSFSRVVFLFFSTQNCQIFSFKNK